MRVQCKVKTIDHVPRSKPVLSIVSFIAPRHDLAVVGARLSLENVSADDVKQFVVGKEYFVDISPVS